MEIPDLGSGILDVVARSAVVYLVLLALLRFGGKRHVGQLSIADLVLVLLIANGVQNAMVGENTTLIGGLAAALTLVVIDRVIDRALGAVRSRSRGARGRAADPDPGRRDAGEGDPGGGRHQG